MENMTILPEEFCIKKFIIFVSCYTERNNESCILKSAETVTSHLIICVHSMLREVAVTLYSK